MLVTDIFDIILEQAGRPIIVRPKSKLIEAVKITELLYTMQPEVEVLAGFLNLLQGDYMEIGVNQGATARNVCQNNPGKTIYGVDWIDNTTMHPNQLTEQPNKETLARHCINFKNFVLIETNSHAVKIPSTVEMVFIDADHQYSGVKNDTENVLRQVKQGWVFWHDYNNTSHFDYMGVTEFINNEIMPRMKVYWLENTFLTFAKIQEDGTH
jgi:hypothetical protein